MQKKEEFLLTSFEYRGTEAYKEELKNINEEISSLINKDFTRLWKYCMSERLMKSLNI